MKKMEGVATHHPKSVKRSTFWHKVVGFKRSIRSKKGLHFVVLHPPKIASGYRPAATFPDAWVCYNQVAYY